VTWYFISIYRQIFVEYREVFTAAFIKQGKFRRNFTTFGTTKGNVKFDMFSTQSASVTDKVAY